MGNWEATKEAYQIREDEKIIPEKDKMGLVQALQILHGLREAYESCEDVREAFDTVFGWIDNAVILFKKMEGKSTNKVMRVTTNGDRIRSMTDEELAEFFASGSSRVCTYCGEIASDYCFENCNAEDRAYTMKNWLSNQAKFRVTENEERKNEVTAVKDSRAGASDTDQDAGSDA